MTPQRPLKSPQPNGLEEHGPTTITGVHRALEQSLVNKLKGEKVFTVVVALLAVVVSLGTIFGGYRVFVGEARGQAKDEIAPVKDEVKKLQAVVEQHLASDAAYKIRQEDAAYRGAIEVRELQKVVLTGRSSPLLNEAPTPPRHPEGK